MADELTVRDIFLQVHTRLGRVEDDVRGLRSEMNAGFSDLRSEMNAGFSELRSEMNAGFSELRHEMNGKLAQMRTEMDARFSAMDARFGRLTGLMVTVLLALVVGVGGLWLK